VVGELCEWCAGRGMPLFLWHVETRWEEVHALALAFGRLRVVIETQWQKILYHIRDLFSLLKACPNVLVESSNFIGQDHVTQLVRSFGAERLLFGSFLPVNDPYASIGTILDADISPEEKALIAGGNLRRLVGEVRP
jgi:predicted TIM-barrel fold metal-dependent hydrolase